MCHMSALFDKGDGGCVTCLLLLDRGDGGCVTCLLSLIEETVDVSHVCSV